MIEYCIKMFFQFLDDMKKQKLRSVLTISGITWGTMAVILLLSFGESFRKASLKNMTGMGNNIVIMGGGKTSLLHNGMPPGRSIKLREEYVQLLKKQISEIGYMSPEIQRDINLTRGKERNNNQCIGVYPEYGILRNLQAQPGGRFINKLDMESRRRVIFMGVEIAKKFFGEDTNPVGKKIMVQGIPFTIIGVMQKKTQNSSYMSQDRNLTFIPFSTCRDVFGITSINRIIYRANDPTDTPKTKEKIYQLLGQKLGFDSKDSDALSMWDTSEMTQYFFYFFLGFEAFLLLGGVFTLLVGGIGVANIMYVAIRERRREIGIKSALGATPRLILVQFMLESFIIMFVGGSLGIMGAYVIVKLAGLPALATIQIVMGVPVINTIIALITVGILSIIGFAAGWSPAKSAADMDPVRALEF
ncbi:MAG: FtsX-like permease family protein [Candidatus Latescibacteria bacterium]|jgi:putative ABC transport system permease protein|nr:FtsX-like permease family protein [Candidatus Latescibacterota bacterium]